jgi:hypothetical protein
MTNPIPPMIHVKGIPYGGIRLKDAFNDLFRLLTPDWKDLAEKGSIWSELELLGEETLNEEDPDRLWELAQARAEATLRKALSERQLSACIKPPNEPPIELEPEEWWTFGKWNGIHSNYTSPADPRTPGPDSSRAGRHLPVFLMRQEFTNWLERYKATKKIKRKTVKRSVDVRGFSKKELEIRDALKRGRVIKHVVGFLLPRCKPGVTFPMSQDLDDEIKVFLKGLSERTSLSSRVTNRKAYDWAQEIVATSRKRADWKRLGVPSIHQKKTQRNDRLTPPVNT